MMKKKSINKKLVLRKRNISNLNSNNLRNIKGGTNQLIDFADTTDIQTQTICQTGEICQI